MNKILEKLFGVTPTAPASDDLAGRLSAMNARAASAQTVPEALEIMREAAGITNDLYKSIGAQKEAPAKEEESLPEGEPAASDADTDTKPVEDETLPAGEPAADVTDEPATDNPDDTEVMADAPADTDNAPAAAPAAIVAASGKEGDSAPATEPASEEKSLAKSVSEILEEASVAASNEGAEPLVDATPLVGELLKSVAATQEREAQNAANQETMLDYLEQIGSLLTKSVEGQAALAARLDRIEGTQNDTVQTQVIQMEALNKSVSQVMEGIGLQVEGWNRTPQGTPSGRAPLAANSVAHVVLGDAAPVQNEAAVNGFTRTELKKSIEAHLRSDRCTNTGITTAHFLSISRTENLSDLDPLIFEVAKAEKTLGK